MNFCESINSSFVVSLWGLFYEGSQINLICKMFLKQYSFAAIIRYFVILRIEPLFSLRHWKFYLLTNSPNVSAYRKVCTSDWVVGRGTFFYNVQITWVDRWCTRLRVHVLAFLTDEFVIEADTLIVPVLIFQVFFYRSFLFFVYAVFFKFWYW